MQLITLGLRVSQLFFAIVVFGLAVDITKELYPIPDARDSPNYRSVSFTAFAGGFGIITSIVGILALFLDSIKSIITMALDGVAALFFLAGGVAVAGLLKGFQCSDLDRLRDLGWSKGDISRMKRLCTQDTADSVFCFLSFLACLALLAYGFIKRKENRSSVV